MKNIKKTILLKFNNNPLVECPGKLKQTNCSTVGELVKLSFKCNKCCKKFTFSNLESKRIKTFKTNGIESVNLEVVLAWILSNEYKKRSNLELVLAGDGAWFNRRNAHNGVYVIMDANTGGVVYQFCMSKTQKRLKKK